MSTTYTTAANIDRVCGVCVAYSEGYGTGDGFFTDEAERDHVAECFAAIGDSVVVDADLSDPHFTVTGCGICGANGTDVYPATVTIFHD